MVSDRRVIEKADAATLREFLLTHVNPGTVVLTDGWPSYVPACGEEHEHRPESIRASTVKAHELLPGVHRFAALVKR